jgi:hypothetical protein
MHATSTITEGTAPSRSDALARIRGHTEEDNIMDTLRSKITKLVEEDPDTRKQQVGAGPCRLSPAAPGRLPLPPAAHGSWPPAACRPWLLAACRLPPAAHGSWLLAPAYLYN